MTVTDLRPNPFQPRGDRPKWAPVYDLLTTRQVDDIVTYAELSAVLGYDFANGDRSPFYGAAKHFLVERGRVLRNIQNVGYRIVPAGDHEDVAKGYWRQSDSRLKRAEAVVKHTDRNEIEDPEARRRIDALEANMTDVQEMSRRALRYAQKAQKVAEQALDGKAVTDERLARHELEMARFKEELAKLKASE